MAELLPGLVRENRGRTLVLFASYSDLERTVRRVADAITADGYPVLIQQPGAPTASLCDEFRAIRESVLFGVDTFWYGVDFPGETLTQVIITRLPFPHPRDPLQIARGISFPGGVLAALSLRNRNQAAAGDRPPHPFGVGPGPGRDPRFALPWTKKTGSRDMTGIILFRRKKYENGREQGVCPGGRRTPHRPECPTLQVGVSGGHHHHGSASRLPRSGGRHRDRYLPRKGALGGIYTGIFYASEEHAFVAACDMPFLNRDFLEYMVSRAAGHDIVVPAPPDGLQPLHAVYSRRCLPAIKGMIERNRLKITGFYPGHRILTINPEVIRTFDPQGRMFMNVNTPEDLRKLSAP